MRVVVFGANGKIGQTIVREAGARGHHVLAVVRDPARAPSFDAGVDVASGDATDARDVARLVGGADAVISAVGNTTTPVNAPVNGLFSRAARALLDGTLAAGVSRLLVLGGAGSLELPSGHQAVDDPSFPAIYKPDALGQREALAVYRAEPADRVAWTYISPAGMIAPGERTARYRTGGDQLLVDGEGQSRISYEDYAVAMVDELERGDHPRRRITVAY